jgi:ligand-binding SRPBCC domain-containing protein
MSVQRLFREQFIPAPLAQVWEYFCDPRNLNEMTPPDMNFEIVSLAPGRMTEGQLIEYKVEFIRGLKSLWLTEIAHVRECEYFVDEQRIGPYRFWYHEHVFEAVDGGTKMTDRVTYAIGFGPLGDLLHALWIGKRLQGIFDFRIGKIKEVFPAM